ncbi:MULTISPECIES: DUF4181 domain-containing protein [Oceanobacillus]|uniref:DUF4181 domain-containing protein n=1 Tax=Oceanobacillus TaxID=182709 RepID=UPI001BE623DF|nr:MULTISPECIES: DUF4181 domain-containing protein [Oceanobacillus]MBT2653078.1 DUF4181 domain-containing protein [Oceanobacillus sp. ISL-73]MCT1577684.1 DUF4181 domain-containing protein [Oceanobacillus kimchii]MCT2136672.1 DUF4181 domain-containing protein [Oceanobacillus kimchii]
MDFNLYLSIAMGIASVIRWLFRHILYRILGVERRTRFIDDEHKHKNHIIVIILVLILIFGVILSFVFNYNYLFLVLSIIIILIMFIGMSIHQVHLEKMLEPETNNYLHSIYMLMFDIVVIVVMFILLYQNKDRILIF